MFLNIFVIDLYTKNCLLNIMKTKIIIKTNNEKIEITAKKCNSVGKITGLMFRTSKTMPLLFEFSKETRMAIHSFFVFFQFYAIWLDENNKIIEMQKVKPFTLLVKPKKPFSKLLEIPMDESYTQIIQALTDYKNKL